MKGLMLERAKSLTMKRQHFPFLPKNKRMQAQSSSGTLRTFKQDEEFFVRNPPDPHQRVPSVRSSIQLHTSISYILTHFRQTRYE